ncbi:hypothetical protein BZG36_04133 [Bifiguratus adelaidae]|uniref:Gfo/Idh/MocA-like oxidoreductase N-terminal domain-containing protein n=1 Tax=Bifiguratus adelaidae TaxID=1938954 RepID=A0A261XW31_9FUNG|nr:hypothetical protein BZG36_04133 [Bifiguratus adelaidae]
MTGNNIRYAIIGAGMMAREHVANLAIIPGSQVVALSDPEPSSIQGTLDKMPADVRPTVKTYSDHKELLAASANEVDALIIASPNDTHFQILCDIFDCGHAYAVLCEKPFCTTTEHCDILEEKVKNYKAPVWVAMEYRFMPPVAKLIQSVHAEEIGNLHMFTIREHRFPFLPKVGDWNRFSVHTGGTLVEKCCHFFDLMRLVVRDEPIRVYASGARDVNHADEKYDGKTPDILDNAYVIVDFAHGQRAMLELCMFAEGSEFQETISAVGSKAKVECYVPGPADYWDGTERQGELVFSPRFDKKPFHIPVEVDETILKAGHHHGSTYYEHVKFRNVVLGWQGKGEKTEIEVGVLDGLRAVRMGIAAETSIKEGMPIKLSF